ncbi:N-formylglutamate amidohydrolase [Chryseolinea sp. T2]|uniref:N-formylglutamate amidohydrolase n=1 Tax=Chryseolinea sp. T2 TaxID=3129255 RepID=UPI003077C84A
MESFRVITPTFTRVPVLVSVPHCGIAFPDELVNEFDSDLINSPDDTDWFVDRLYDFAPSLGMTMITAVYSRWVIDLNRDPTDKPLYSDGRIITGLCPVTDFTGRPLYKDARKKVDDDEIIRRRKMYYAPYHDQLKLLLSELKSNFGKVLLWDCHSIRQYVKTIYNDKFPDLILGDADGASAGSGLIELAYDNLRNSNYSVSHNFPFKGGYITRAYGTPDVNQHALQLEMAKVNYMDDAEIDYDDSRANKMRALLSFTLKSLAEELK